ncbi:MAG: ABC transporter permease subunit [Clostridiales bacterium]|jgi:arabinogalactan oligomer/maltooligosaccharide transport system permease protein|nr:ABC transporter permease subunit [Clostridiales bacterium]
MKSRKFLLNSAAHLVLAVLSLVWVLPIIFALLTSFRAESGSAKTYIIPKAFTLENYTGLFNVNVGGLNYSRWFFNTLLVAAASCVLSAFFILCVAYAMSRLRFTMRRPFMNVALILGMFPGFMSMIAVYYILKGFGFLESGATSLVALVLVYSGGAGLGFYITKGFFDTIPKALDEAAYLDGCTKWQVFTKITLPLSKPIAVYTLIVSFMAPWTDYIFAKVIMGQNRDYYTIAIGLWTMLEKEFIETYYTRFFAGCVLISIPISILFLLTQKFYTDSMSGAVKG